MNMSSDVNCTTLTAPSFEGCGRRSRLRARVEFLADACADADLLNDLVAHLLLYDALDVGIHVFGPWSNDKSPGVGPNHLVLLD